MAQKIYVDVNEIMKDWGGVPEQKDIRLLQTLMRSF